MTEHIVTNEAVWAHNGEPSRRPGMTCNECPKAQGCPKRQQPTRNEEDDYLDSPPPIVPSDLVVNADDWRKDYPLYNPGCPDPDVLDTPGLHGGMGW